MPDQREPADVVIVGAGASGTLLASRLLRGGSDRGPVVLIERSGGEGQGVAYSTTEPSHVLNIPAAGMSAVHDEPNHFVDWLRHSGIQAGPDDFIPRSMYGRYLRSLLDAPGGRADLLRMRDEVVKARPSDRGVIVELAGGSTIHTRHIILAIGNSRPRTPSFMKPALSSRYIEDPWSATSLAQIEPTDRVLLVGTGLTAVDVMLTLESRGHSATIHAVSRHGLLPQVHRLPPERPSSLRALPALPSPLTTSHLVRWVRSEIRTAEAEGADWRDVINDLRPWTQSLWMELSQSQRRVFLERVARFWSVVRHRMAPRVGEMIERMRSTGQLIVMGARPRVERRGDGFRVGLQSSEGSRDLRVNWIVNCTGPELDPARSEEPLVCSLLSSGATRRDPLGLGFDCTADGRLIDASGAANRRLWAIGSLRVGSLWESTSVPEIREQAAALALELDRESALV
ncbi:MAG: FAD/NAD(P)-binding protein [Actinomycetota bacterium]